MLLTMWYSQPAPQPYAGDEGIYSFSRININGDVDVVLDKREKEGVEIPGYWRGKLTVNNTGDVLFIDAGSTNGKGKPQVRIGYRQLSGLSVNGGGEVICDSDIRAAKFDLVCKGAAGWVKLGSIHVNQINITIIGNKNLEITGTASSKNFNIQGSGQHLFRLSAPAK